jgi:hypothetical protein
MNRFLTASRLLADLPLTKVDGRQIEFTVRATSCADASDPCGDCYAARVLRSVRFVEPLLDMHEEWRHENTPPRSEPNDQD